MGLLLLLVGVLPGAGSPPPHLCPPLPAPRYHLHPGVFDACIHLAPVPSAGAPISVTRVPVAASALLLPGVDGKASLGWASAESVHIDPQDQSASNSMRWTGAAGTTAGMRMVGLLARAVPAGANARLAASALEAAGANLLFTVEWQAHSSDGSSTSGTAASAPVPLWQLGSARAVVARQGGSSSAAFAAGHLALLQTVRRSGGRCGCGLAAAALAWVAGY